MWAEVGIGFAQLGVIGWGLWRWGKDIEAHRVVIDQEGEALGKIGQAFARQTEA